MLVDTHAHLHFDKFADSLDKVLSNAKNNQVTKIINVGVNALDSKLAVDLANSSKQKDLELFASAGLHPHDASNYKSELADIKKIIKSEKVVAIGECGLDYYKNFSSRKDQRQALVGQIELALSNDLPLIFHIRDAFDDFFEITKDYSSIRGVLHSFSASLKEVEKALEYNLFFGLNGIMTFTKDQKQLEAAKIIPDEKLLLETDCPFLAPIPYRGQMNEPAFVKTIAQFLADLRNQSFDEISSITTNNAIELFNI
jgi:TatD DNase family protein